MSAPRPSSRRSSKAGSEATGQFNTGGVGGNQGGTSSLYVILDGKNVTPRSLLSFLPKPAPEASLAPDTAPLSPTSPASPSQTGTGFRRTVLPKQTVDLRPSTAEDVILKETVTTALFHLPTLCVSIDQQAQYQTTQTENRKYEELCISKTSSRSEAFRPRHVQTLNAALKHKEIQAVTKAIASVGVGASEFDIYDAFLNPPLPRAKALELSCGSEVSTTLSSCLKKPLCLIKASPDLVFPPPVALEKPHRRKKPTNSSSTSTAQLAHTSSHTATHNTAQLASETHGESFDVVHAEEDVDSTWAVTEGVLPSSLTLATRTMEKIVAQNNFHAKHMAYRNYPSQAELEKSTVQVSQPRLEDLFFFHLNSEASGAGDEGVSGPGYTVTCLEWSEENKDLLVAGYAGKEEGGLVLFWSLKNPLHPERVLRQREGVTALSFSKLQPHIVAVGDRAGGVRLYDLRRDEEEIGSASGGHTEQVEDLVWIDRGPEKIPREALVSVGADGAVVLWTMKKALEGVQVMTLKRESTKEFGANPLRGVPGKDGEKVFKKSSGLSIDFPDRKNNVYLVGTDDGVIHKCSTAYTEQDIETYRSHTAPVYQVKTNPFLEDVFLSCAADWSIRLWHAKHGVNSVLQSVDLVDAVNDVQWSHLNATAFAAVADDGRVELWDLAVKPLDPLVVHYPGGNKVARTCVRFSKNSPVLVAGDATGKIAVMRIYNCEIPVLSQQEQQQRLAQCLSKTNN